MSFLDRIKHGVGVAAVGAAAVGGGIMAFAGRAATTVARFVPVHKRKRNDDDIAPHYPQAETEEQKRDRRRQAWGIDDAPPAVRKVIAQVAQKAVAAEIATDSRVSLADNAKALREALERDQIAWEAFYADLLQQQETEQRAAMIRGGLIAKALKEKQAAQLAQEEADDIEAITVLMLMMD